LLLWAIHTALNRFPGRIAVAEFCFRGTFGFQATGAVNEKAKLGLFSVEALG
jgi:hypothetical protein